MQKKVAEQRQVSSRPRHTSNSHWQKSGCLEFKGHKSKVFAVLSLAEMWLYKSEQVSVAAQVPWESVGCFLMKVSWGLLHVRVSLKSSP